MEYFWKQKRIQFFIDLVAVGGDDERVATENRVKGALSDEDDQKICVAGRSSKD